MQKDKTQHKILCGWLTSARLNSSKNLALPWANQYHRSSCEGNKTLVVAFIKLSDLGSTAVSCNLPKSFHQRDIEINRYDLFTRDSDVDLALHGGRIASEGDDASRWKTSTECKKYTTPC